MWCVLCNVTVCCYVIYRVCRAGQEGRCGVRVVYVHHQHVDRQLAAVPPGTPLSPGAVEADVAPPARVCV